MFVIENVTESKVLSFFESALVPEELMAFAKEDGFNAPNDFPFEKFLESAQKKLFPRDGQYELEWAIYECGLERLETYSKGIQIYTSALYVYCNKMHQWGICTESHFLFSVVELELKGGPSQYAEYFSKFIEWLHESVEADNGYNDYYLLVTWLLLARLTAQDSSDCFRSVLNYLLAKQLTGDEIDALNVSKYSRLNWLELHKSIPLTDSSLNVDFEQIISGRCGLNTVTGFTR
jgi:hypothetical protein